MPLAGLDWQVVPIPLVAGLNTKAQTQALDAPGLSTCRNVEFDEVGGLRLRHPYASIGVNILGGGTLSNVRKLVVVDDELLAFTADTLYSWSETLTAWVSKGAHLAVAVTEATRFGNGSDQVFADRAQLLGVVVMVWTEVLASAVTAYLAAYDATTNATLIARTSFGAGNVRPRVTSLATKLIVTWTDGTSLRAAIVSPSAPTFTTAGSTTLITHCPAAYDIVKDPAADQAVFVGQHELGTSYVIGKVTAALALTTSSKVQTADGVIALALTPAVANLALVMRATAAMDIKGDLITLTTLADLTMNTAIGACGNAVLQLTGAFRSVPVGPAYRCYVFWSQYPSTANALIESNWLDTSATIGTENNAFAVMLTIASRAFDYGGTVYLWSVFEETSTAGGGGAGVTTIGIRGQLQNTYFMLGDDGGFVTRAAPGRAGGRGYYTGHLAGVALVSGATGYAWAGTERQIIVLGGTDQSGYAARDPHDIGFAFDSDSARRVVQMGRTAYVSGGLLLQYDGEGLTEVGFMQYPWSLALAIAAGGAAAAGKYSYKATLRWDNARGEAERSTTAIGGQITIAANDQVNVTVISLYVSRKQGSLRAPAVEIWRTKVDPPVGAPFYLVTSRNPSVTGDNGYVVQDFDQGGVDLQGDVFTDAILETKEESPENADILPRLAPPGATILVASDTRMFLAGIPGDPFAVRYSLLRNEGEIAAFHDDLRFTLPSSAGPITGLAIMNREVAVFTATAVYRASGEGFTNTGDGGNYTTDAVPGSAGIGAVSHDSITLTPVGLVFFSRKGWYRLSPGWDLEYIGAKVEDFNSDTWVAAQVVESQHQVRFLSSGASGRMLMFDYLVGEWSEWTQANGRDLAMWRGTPMLLDATPKKEQSTFAAVDYPMEIVTGWIKPGQMMGFARVRRVMVLGEYKNDHAQLVALGFDYGVTYTDSAVMGFVGLTAGDPTQLRQGPSRQRIEAIRIRVLIVAGTGGGAATYPALDCVTLTGLALEVGIRRGLYPRLAASRKQ